MKADLDHIHQSAIDIARQGGQHTLTYFKKSVDIERKSDDSPVTVADRKTESVMREAIEDLFPDHGIIGEEHGHTNASSPVQWILDPIDGTKSFIHGVPFYTTLIGIVVDDDPVVGIVYAPALDELCEAARGKGTRLNGTACSVRECETLSEATFLSTDVYTAAGSGYGDAFDTLIEKTRIHRTWGDAYGHMMVATGRADLMFDPELHIWDAAPLLPVLREAGGIFCDTDGQETIESGNGFSCSRSLLPEVLEVFNPDYS
ncbi:histidinol-phosphate phosphatase [Fodinibius roseus]|uniref:Histidinol-phosphate phosphatase n=1 Tax=Fodinibius roseus TaxID=1194090 RepID=A0A1M5FYJ9_9BACT|nr:inositol monophosphatase family protein [Fodinibius roseus]SHF96605.1 histidinol-phosphate phosphatase [Fodinibius roseus]